MKTETLPRSAEFTHHRPQNRILVENRDGEVIIRAARNNFSPKRKRVFLREMAAEGFIPDHLEWLAQTDVEELPGVTWVIDDSWMATRKTVKEQSRAFMFKALLSASALWVALMLLLLAGAL